MRIKDLLFDVNYMKQYAADAARMVTTDITRFGEVEEQIIKDAAIARFQLDRLLLDEQSLIEKWSQYVIINNKHTSIVFKGSKKDCEDYLKKNSTMDLELIYLLPDDMKFSWNVYFRNVEKRSNIDIVFYF